MATEAKLTVTAEEIDNCILVSLKSEGDYSGVEIDNRFYSITSLPPADLAALHFWAPILSDISRFFSAE
jgi:hypothetical protein